ncbi:Phosphatase IMPL1, chloroplastic [Linum perenne]
MRNLCTKAVISEVPYQSRYRKMGASSTGSIPLNQLIQVVEIAAKTGSEVNKPRNITYKGLTDLVTELVLPDLLFYLADVVDKDDLAFLPLGLDMEQRMLHMVILALQFLWESKASCCCCDEAKVEFVGGPMAWNTRTFSATAGGGAFCNGQRIHASQTDMVERSLLVTGFGYEHDDAWSTNIELFKEFTDVSRVIFMILLLLALSWCEESLGAASVDMCPVALGIVEAYWEYRLKPWDMAPGVLVNFMSSIQMSFVHQEKYGLYSLLLRLQRIKAVQICFQAHL